VHGVHHAVEGGIEEGLDRFVIEVPNQFRRAFEIGKQHRDLLPLAFQGAFSRADLPGQIGRRVAEGSPDRCVDRGGGPGGSHLRVTRPDQNVAPLIDRQALALDEFVLHILQGRVIELELSLEGAIGDAAPLAQQGDHVIHHRDKVHRVSSFLCTGPVCPCAPS
jgi:hypothetical protein